MRELGFELVRLREAHPELVRIRLLQAKEAAREGRIEDVITELDSAIEQCSEKLPAALELARYYGRLGRIEQAIEVCRRVIGVQSSAAAPRILLADLYAATDRIPEARETLDSAVGDLTGKDKLAVQVGLAQLLLPRGHRDEAISLLRQLGAEHTDNVQILAALLRLPEVQRDALESQQLVDKIKNVEGERGLLWRIEQAKVWLREDRWTQRQREIEEHLGYCLRSDPGWSEPVLVLGRMYEMQRRDDEAEKVYRMALSSAPQQVGVVAQLLALLERGGRFADAAAILQRMPQDIPALNAHRVEAAIGLGDFASAISHLEQQTAARPDDAASRITLAKLIYGHKKDVPGAMKLLDEAAAISPDLPAAASTKASILHAEGRDGEAVSLLNDAVTRRNDFAAYQARADFHAATGRADLAEKDYVHLTTFAESAVEGYAVLARFYRNSGRMNDAITAYDAGLAIEPDNADLRRMLIKALVVSGQPQALDRAVHTLDELLTKSPDDVELLAVRAAALLARNTDESIRDAKIVLDRVVELDPRNVNAHLQLIELAGKRGDLKEADRLAIRALGANPDSAALILARAGVEADLDNVRLARGLAESVIQTEPKDVKARNLLSKLALQGGDVAAAQAFNEEARKLDPADEAAQVIYAEILERGGQQDQVIQALESYCETDRGRGSVRALLALADVHRARNEFEKAGARIDQAARVSADNGPVFLSRLRLLGAQGRFDEVRKQLAERRADRPGESGVLLPAAMILASSGVVEHLREAKSVLGELVLLEPAHVPVHLALAQVAYQLGDTDASQQAYRRVLELEPDHRQALNDLAWVLAHHRGEDGVREAEMLVDKGLRLYPDDVHLLDTRGVVLLTLGQYEEARKDLERCVALAEPHPATRAKALLHLAQVLGKMPQEAAAARSALEEAQRIDQIHRVLSDEERAAIAALLESP
jgi:tetratricopeptide (TPR) repeat protein